MKNQGRHHYRLKNNPIEKLFAETWEDQNRATGGTLDYLLAKDPNHPAGEVTPRDREVAATVIQWLGSPVGQNFLKDTLKSDVVIRRNEVVTVLETALATLNRYKGEAWQTDDDFDLEINQALSALLRQLKRTTEEYLSEKSW